MKGDQRNVDRYTVESVSRALRTLDAVARLQPATLLDLVEAVDLNKATVYRLLSTMAEHDVVLQDSRSKRYSLGPRLIALGHRALEATDGVSIAISEVEALAERLSLVLTVNLPAIDSVVEAARLPRHGRGEYTPLRIPIPYHASASGLVFLAFDEHALLERLASAGLPRFASNTFTNRKGLERALRRIREEGYALVSDTLEEGVTAVACPVFDHHGRVALTLGATAPSGAMTKQSWSSLADELLHAAQVVTHRLGGVVACG